MSILLDLASKANKAINAATAEYRKAPEKASAGSLSVVVLREINGWEPTIRGQKILTGELRGALGRALGGLAYNIAVAEAGGKVSQ